MNRFRAPALPSALLGLLLSAGAGAQTTTLVVTLPPGSTVDVLARSFAQQMETRLQQRVMVDNKPGAGLALGMQAVAGAPADGHTLAFTPATPVTIQPHRNRKLSYGADSFVPVCQTFENVFMLAVPQHSPHKDIKAFMEKAKASPGTLRYGHSGAGSSPHLMAAQLWQEAGLDVADVPYKGETAFVPSLVSGDIESGMVTTSLAQQQKLRPLVVFAAARSKWFPQVPTAAELGYKVPASAYGGLFAKAGTPPAMLSRLESACRDAVQSPEYQALADSLQQNSTFLGRADFTRRVTEDHQSKGRLLETVKLTD